MSWFAQPQPIETRVFARLPRLGKGRVRSLEASRGNWSELAMHGKPVTAIDLKISE